MHSHRAPIALAWLALLGACAPPDGPYATSPSSLSAALADSAALRVLTINARARFDRWRDRFPLVADEIVRLSPHLVALQEVTVGAGQHDALQKYIAARSPGGVSPYAVYGEQGDMGGNVILSRLPLLARARHDLSNGRIAIMVHVALDNGATLRVFNTHLHHVRDDEAVRTQQISDVLGWIEPEGPTE